MEGSARTNKHSVAWLGWASHMLVESSPAGVVAPKVGGPWPPLAPRVRRGSRLLDSAAYLPGTRWIVPLERCVRNLHSAVHGLRSEPANNYAWIYYLMDMNNRKPLECVISLILCICNDK